MCIGLHMQSCAPPCQYCFQVGLRLCGSVSSKQLGYEEVLAPLIAEACGVSESCSLSTKTLHLSCKLKHPTSFSVELCAPH